MTGGTLKCVGAGAISVATAILGIVGSIALVVIGGVAFCLGWIFDWIARACQRALDWIWTPRRL